LSRRLPAFTSFLVLGTLVVLLSNLSSPSDPENSILFGFSLERILLSGGLLVLTLTLLFLTLKLLRTPKISAQLWVSFTQRGWASDLTFLLAIFLFSVAGIILAMPPYRLGGLAAYIDRLSALLGWLAVIGAVGCVTIFLERRASLNPSIRMSRKTLALSASVLGGFLLLGLIIRATGIGYQYPGEYWYGAGVPMTGLQILFACVIGALFLLYERNVVDKTRLDIFIFIALWLVAGWLWSQLPASPNYFLPDTADNVLYPYSDGATFDLGGQFALIGQGFFNGIFFDRVLYSSFLAYLHLFFEQDYEVLLTAQAAVYAVFPAVVYLLGKELHSRALGVTAGVLIVARGLSAITASKWIDVASPKMMLTDFPTAIGIAVFLLVVVKWWQQPTKMKLLIWAGAVFGLAVMIRTHVFTLLPIVLIFVLLRLGWNWKRVVQAGLLILLGLLSLTLPWELRNQSRGIPMFYMYYSRIELILRYRYGIGGDAYTLPTREVVSGVSPRSRVELLHQEKDGCKSFPCSITNHVTHNIITSFVSLPASLTFKDTYNIVKSDLPYWNKGWRDGQIDIGGWVAIIFSLVLIALGAAAIWRQSRAGVWLPAFFFLAYLLTNSIGLTSGGRYVTPVDWILYFYFAAGAVQLLYWLLAMTGYIAEIEPANESYGIVPVASVINIRALVPIIAGILGIGVLIPLPEFLFQPRYQAQTPSETFASLRETGLFERSNFSEEELTAFLAEPGAMILTGRALYPRYYPAGEGESDLNTHYKKFHFQRLVFTVIGPDFPGAIGLVIPGDSLPKGLSLQAADVVVLGCWTQDRYSPLLNAVVVFVTSGDGYVYNRSPESPLHCPLKIP
ncbi:MAG TPA: hypothetical protein PKE23_01875, partial [Anaerolineales bacterium]|nr:hypothetical protein [Anaerolineales bacterium]